MVVGVMATSRLTTQQSIQLCWSGWRRWTPKTLKVEESADDASPQMEDAEDTLAVDAAVQEDEATADLIDELAGESAPSRQRLSKSERRRRRKQRRRKAA